MRKIAVETGGLFAAGAPAADALLDENRLTITTAEYAVGELVTPTVRATIYRRFLAANADLRPSQEITRISTRTVTLRNVHSGAETDVTDVDLVVDWRGAAVVRELEAAVEMRNLPHYIVGDCVAPRQVHIAIAEGAMVARQI